MKKIQAKKVLGYVFLPGIMPRAQEMFGSGFGFLAYLIATIFNATRLLPNEHPYLRPANIGTYGIRAVFAQAGANIVFSRKNIDQILIFYTMIAGVILLALQFLFLIIGLLTSPAAAAGMFHTEYPERDIAFVLLDKVFGIPGFFNSIYAPPGDPLPFHQALHGLFQFYSMALLLVAVIIFLYYVLVVVAETAQTGTPFGRRFNHIWAPIRLVVALGLLVPIHYGLNSGQYIVLTAAKMGSGFATNGWLLFNQSIGGEGGATGGTGGGGSSGGSTSNNPLGIENKSLYARAKAPDAWPQVKFMMLAATCRESYERLGVQDIKAYLVKMPLMSEEVAYATGDYEKALNFYNRGDVIVRFGIKDEELYGDQPGAVHPLCGEIIVHTTAKVNKDALAGAYHVQKTYFEEMMRIWDLKASGFADIMAYRYLDVNRPVGCSGGDMFSADNCEPGRKGVTNEEIAKFRDDEQEWGFTKPAIDGRQAMIDNGSLAVPEAVLKRGWGGAGIWYNRVAEVNGAFFSAVINLPTPSRLPLPMQKIMEANTASNQNVSIEEMFTPHLRLGETGNKIEIADHELRVGKVLHQAYQQLGHDDLFMSSEMSNKQNIFRDTLNLLLGLNGLFTMRENTDIHPLAQLVGLGKGIVDSAIRNLFTATAFGAAGGAFNAFPDTKGMAGIASIGSRIFVALATVGLGVGFMLYYVLPFLPFMYFFFSVGTWLKTIFEAMVGAPLWALAHLRIDGHGLPGESAMGGYFMILEIFLRPILTVFGLLGALIIFTAMVKVLNEIFTLVTANLAGFDNNPCVLAADGACSAPAGGTSKGIVSNPDNPLMDSLLQFKRDTIDEFFFTIIYAVIVYMMANSCFKMIDQVPGKILRWMGAGVQVFSDDANTEQAVESMKRYAAYSGANMTGQLGSGMRDASAKIGEGTAQLFPGAKGSRTTGTP